jgi:DNA-binding NarL/FixJ family response regulator
MSPEEIFAKRLNNLGASGYLNKQSSEEEVVKAMELFFTGRKYVSQKYFDMQHNIHKRQKRQPLYESFRTRNRSASATTAKR